MKKQKTQIKIEKGKIYQCLDSSNDVTSDVANSSYYIVKEVDDKKGEAKILIVNRNRSKDILDNDEVIISFQPLDYVKAFDNEPVTIKIKHLEKLNLKEIK